MIYVTFWVYYWDLLSQYTLKNGYYVLHITLVISSRPYITEEVLFENYALQKNTTHKRFNFWWLLKYSYLNYVEFTVWISVPRGFVIDVNESFNRHENGFRLSKLLREYIIVIDSISYNSNIGHTHLLRRKCKNFELSKFDYSLDTSTTQIYELIVILTCST